MFQSRSSGVWVIAGVALALALVACAPSRQARGPVERSGFLGSYEGLEPGKDGQARLVYVNPKVDWKSYTAIQLESVTLWPGQEGTLAKLSPEDQKMLADRLYQALHDAMAKESLMVTAPGPGVMRVRAALTEAKGTNVPLNAVATVIPQIRTLAALTALAADTSMTVGAANAEVEVTDSLTGERLAAAVDARVGQRSVQAFGTWSQVQAAFDAWGQQFNKRLLELRGSPATK